MEMLRVTVNRFPDFASLHPGYKCKHSDRAGCSAAESGAYRMINTSGIERTGIVHGSLSKINKGSVTFNPLSFIARFAFKKTKD
jgi:hypothetical protein